MDNLHLTGRATATLHMSLAQPCSLRTQEEFKAQLLTTGLSWPRSKGPKQKYHVSQLEGAVPTEHNPLAQRP